MTIEQNDRNEHLIRPPVGRDSRAGEAPTSAAAPDAPSSERARRRWLALTVLALAQFLVVLDATIVNIALPVIGEQLHMGTAMLAWVITAYILPFGGFLLLGGRFADRYGHRRLFLIGVASFGLASAASGLATTSTMLLAARAFQGASAALLAPAALALVTRLFPETAHRTKALGIWGGVAGIGSAAGVLLGGVLTGMLGWQAVFFVNVPVTVIVLGALPSLVARDPVRPRFRLDVAGAILITLALGSAVGALSAIEQLGPLSLFSIVLAVAAVALTGVFVVVERRAAHPLVPFQIFRNRSLAVGNLAMVLTGAGMVALFFALSVYLQSALGYDALTAGIAQLPLALTLVIIAGVVPALVGRFGLRNVLGASALVLAGGLFWLAAAPSEGVFVVHILGPSVVLGAGLGGVFVAATQLSVDRVSEGEAGLASGLVNTSQQVGGALGLAVLVSIGTARTATLVGAGASRPDALTAGLSLVFLGAAVFALVTAALSRLRR